jgi:hypothetical protein
MNQTHLKLPSPTHRWQVIPGAISHQSQQHRNGSLHLPGVIAPPAQLTTMPMDTSPLRAAALSDGRPPASRPLRRALLPIGLPFPDLCRRRLSFQVHYASHSHPYPLHGLRLHTHLVDRTCFFFSIFSGLHGTMKILPQPHSPHHANYMLFV